ncbi:MAG TPA: amidohydrolase [Halanaerobiales bacterium]|nr:amidohydrolase [Halanaerobiales bacterium]
MKLFINANLISSAFAEQKLSSFVVNNKGKIVEKGKKSKLKEKYPKAKIKDLEEKTVIPGLNDSHLHLFQYGLAKSKIDLSETTSIKEIQEKVKNYIANNELKENEWIEGKGWNDENFDNPAFPTSDDLDEISEEHPIILKRTCFHVAAVNSKALQFCNIDKNTPDPEGGELGKDNKGKPNGLLYDEAIELIENMIPQKEVDEIKKILKESFNDALKTGLTSLQVDDFFNIENPEKVLEAYLELRENNEIPLRINLQMRIPSKKKMDEFEKRGLITGYGDDYFKIGPVKFVLDGSLGARTAALKEPYNDKKSTKGKKLYKQDKFNEICKYAADKDFQIAVHAIGDKAIEMALTGFDYAYENDQIATNNRPIIVHAQISNNNLNNEMKNKGIIASIQPIFLKSDWQAIENRVGKNRSKMSYPWKSYYDKGISLSGSSDAPIEPFNPFLGIYAAVTRQDFNEKPKDGWKPKEKMSIAEALEIFTKGSAYQSFEEDIKGNLETGKLADFLVIDRNIKKIDKNKIKDIQVLETYVGGNLVYQK